MNRRLGLISFLLASLLVARPATCQSSQATYAHACRVAIGDVADFSCGDGAIVPVTVNNRSVRPTKGMECDRPALLFNGKHSVGQCVPNSRILSLSTGIAQVAVMCRQKLIRRADSLTFDEIDVIAHNPITGATCWFQATGQGRAPVDGTKVLSPTRDTTSGFWNTPEATVHEGCGNCHDSGPFIFSPFVGQVWDRMPRDPFGPYFHVDPGQVGFDKWPRKALAPRDNTCLGCHRIGVGETCGSLTRWMTGRAVPTGADAWARTWPGSHGMPPNPDMTPRGWHELYAASVDQVLSCCKDPTQKSCRTTSIPPPPG
jgi:hypothetical protein